MVTVLVIDLSNLFLKSFTPFPTFPHGGRSWFYISPLGEIERGLKP